MYWKRFMPFKDPEKRKEYSKKYYQENKDNIKPLTDDQRKRKVDYLKKYYENNKETFKEKGAERWERIKSNEELHNSLKEKRKIKKDGTRSYRNTRKKIVESLGGKCIICGSTENLEVNHKNLADTEQRRLTKKWNSCRVSLSDIDNGMELELMCNHHHKLWSCCQRKAAMKLFSSLSMEDQIKLTKEFFDTDQANLHC